MARSTLEEVTTFLESIGYSRYFQLSITSKSGVCWDLPTHLTCPIQSHICSTCYGDKGHYQTHGPQNIRLNNWVLLHREGFDAWKRWMAGRLISLFWEDHKGFFRFHSTGDVFSWDYWMAIRTLVRGFPNLRFWLPTHNYRLMRRAAREGGFPFNLSVGLSQIYRSAHGQRVDAAYRYIRRKQLDAHIFKCYVFRNTKELPNGVWVCPASGRHNQKKAHSCRAAQCSRCYEGTDHVAFRWH